MRRNLSLLTKAALVACTAIGVSMTLFAGEGVNWRNLLYFTTQSNIWIMIVAAVGFYDLLIGKEPDRLWSVIKLIFTVSITLTGVVYCFILAPTFENPFHLSSVLVHVLSPILAIVDFFLCCNCFKLKGRDSFWGIVPPIYYLVFASIGYVCNWPFSDNTNYPYFFLNWGSPVGAWGFSSEFPFMGVMWYVFALLISLIIVTRCYIWLSGSREK